MAEELFWVDKTARKVIEREKKLKRGIKKYRTEMGVGASGIPHIGSAGDGVRSFALYLGLNNLKVPAEFIAFSDDRDGLRKVPVGFSKELEKHIGKPVSLIPDPFKCHKSFGDHISSLLIDAFNKIGLKFTIKRASQEYPKGTFDKEIIEILDNAQEAGRIIEETTSSTKFREQLPFLPICKGCGRIYTTTAYKWDKAKKKIEYRCDAEFVGKNSNTGEEILVKGCGHEGTCGIRDGKLAWKVEFAARWKALKINYEAYGKDILESIKSNDEICRNILRFEPPVHSFYEMFTERGGKKISKSAGNVFTPQNWLNYASVESVRLLFLKKLAKTRVVDADAIPAYEDEVDELAKIYFGDIKIKNPRELAHYKRLYEYIHFLKPPKKKPVVMIPFNTLARMLELVTDKKLVIKVFQKTGHLPAKLTKEQEKEIAARITRVNNWIKDQVKEKKPPIKLNAAQKKALHQLADELKKKWTEKSLLGKLYEIAQENNLKSSQFFKAAYLAILESERGPRLAPLILAIGQKKVAEILKKV